VDKIARLRTHQRNIDRYQNMLKTRLTEIELHFVERRPSEERFAMEMLCFMSPVLTKKRNGSEAAPNAYLANSTANQMMALPHAVITTPVSMPLNSLRSSSFIIEGNLLEKATSAKRST